MSETHTSNALNAYACWVAQTARDWPQDALHIAKRSLIDTLACMVPGAADSAPSKLWPVVKTWGSGPSTAVARSESLSAPGAALFNGTCAHALDFDDNFDPAKAHSSAVLIPALLALAEAEDAPIGDVFDGYIVGLQIMGRVGQGVNPFHRSRGWHATGTMGAIGAAAGCARLLRLDAEKAAHAISLSTSLAGGFMSQFGSDTKPIHAGLAASGGVQAALMARGGITAGTGTLEGPTGLRTLMVGPDVEELAASMEGKAEHGQTMRFDADEVGEPLHILEHGLKIKRFPNCGSLHRALDGLIALMQSHDFSADMVENVHIAAPAAHLRNLMHENPQTPAQAKFSLEYSLAAALYSGDVGLDDYEPEAIHRPQVRALMPLITKDYVEKLESDFPTQVHLTLKDGRNFESHHAMPVGSKAHPMSDEQLWQKLETCLASARGFTPDSLLEELANLDPDKPCRQLMASTQM
ncbi:MmgE/PrpD family protein [Erythrobacter sp. SCSIO 43205]|uniref:MmgE/PrpD family protein n=1 Tax=Erythrobacter sp. SCSIO 43205 TaxID=2779361 RepID=UPI001CA7F529|nr:MmgE/PrpD family protein [Erythrobacter sp. SCSIO 43205]UAB78640.1 MmgE/PrpD family protein [Erythrobacter sp. SCSIO 43205]